MAIGLDVLAIQLKYSRRTEGSWCNAIPNGNGAEWLVQKHLANDV